MHFNIVLEFKLGDAPEVFTQDVSLNFQLMFVAGVLVMASAAPDEVRTPRLHPVRKSVDYGFGFGSGEAGLLLSQGGLNLFSGENEGNEYGLAASAIFGRQASEAVAAINQLFDGEKQEVILRQGLEVRASTSAFHGLPAYPFILRLPL